MPKRKSRGERYRQAAGLYETPDEFESDLDEVHEELSDWVDEQTEEGETIPATRVMEQESGLEGLFEDDCPNCGGLLVDAGDTVFCPSCSDDLFHEETEAKRNTFYPFQKPVLETWRPGWDLLRSPVGSGSPQPKQPAKKKTIQRASRRCPRPTCNKKVKATANYCKSCGIRLDNYCPNPKCNKRVQKTANYCDGCGHQLKS